MTFIAHNPAAMRHDAPGHPETAKRAEAILRAFDADPAAKRFPRIEPDRLLTRDEALRVHTPRHWLNLEHADREGQVLLDPDTYVVAGSLDAARGTARLALQAVERALKENEGGFVVARPPGHHATADRSMGFCLFNNVALAARHALDHGARRVLVFDHDVHHGNGTQDLFYDTDSVLYQSFHLSPHYPGTGRVEEIGAGAGAGFTMNAPLPHGAGDEEVRSLVANVLLPAAAAYRPDLILFSSGFDSLEGDPLGGLRLTAPFFGEIAGRFRGVCPRIVFFLEGGYQLDKIGHAALAELRALDGPAIDAPQGQRAMPSETALRAALRESWPQLR